MANSLDGDYNGLPRDGMSLFWTIFQVQMVMLDHLVYDGSDRHPVS